MKVVRSRLEQDLRAAVSRLRQVAGAEALEEITAGIGIQKFAEDVDKIQAQQTLDLTLASRARLLGRVNRLAAALRRLEDGVYGTCVRCYEAIQPARLKALPEVETCLACQEQLERRAA
jgi:RNA polymerase-binding transcription factor DksA